MFWLKRVYAQSKTAKNEPIRIVRSVKSDKPAHGLAKHGTVILKGKVKA